MAGISGNAEVGCYSLALSGGYADDIDLGESFTYTGSGGTKLQGIVNGKRLNLRTAPQTSDQSFRDSHNASLLTSSKDRKPIRVIRGYKGQSQWSPSKGYVYSGLYVCTKAWRGDGLSGFKVCKYAFERLPGQDPLSVPLDEQDEEGGEAEGEGEQEEVSEALELSNAVPKGYQVEVVITSNLKPFHYDVIVPR